MTFRARERKDSARFCKRTRRSSAEGREKNNGRRVILVQRAGRPEPPHEKDRSGFVLDTKIHSSTQTQRTGEGTFFGEHQQGDYKQIRESFPFDPIAIVAQVKRGNAYFEKKDYQMAAGTCEDFVNSNPDDENAAHGLKRLGESYEKQSLTIDRDQAITLKAIDRFTFLKNRYPTSPYAKDAGAHLSALTRKLDIELTGRWASSAIKWVATTLRLCALSTSSIRIPLPKAGTRLSITRRRTVGNWIILRRRNTTWTSSSKNIPRASIHNDTMNEASQFCIPGPRSRNLTARGEIRRHPSLTVATLLLCQIHEEVAQL